MTTTARTCPLCNKVASIVVENSWTRYGCDRCGEFRVSEELSFSFHMAPRTHLLSGVTRNAFERGTTLELTTTNIVALEGSAPAIQDVETKGKMLLRHLARRSKTLGEYVSVDYATDCPLCFAAGENELHFLLTYLLELDWISWEASTGQQQLFVTASGWISSQAAPRDFSEKAFVAMSFADEMLPAWLEGLLPAIRADARFRAIRLDCEEHNDMIDDRIQAEIKESRFLVADLTGHRKGVYFEAGLALGLGMPVIWTCRKDSGDETHFDTRQYNRIQWQTPAELREKLALRIRATIGVGPLGAGDQ